jgi:hypothetical protein
MNLLEKHRQAMASADEAFLARRNGHVDEASRLFAIALQYEMEAAIQAEWEQVPEPTRSVLYRSASTLALDCGRFREAERLAARGLSGDPPDDIAVELREVLAQVFRIWPPPSDPVVAS